MDHETNDKMTDRIAGECVAVRLRMLNRIVTNMYDEGLRPLGLKISQMNILVATAKMGLARPTEMCKVLHLENSTLSRNVDRMRARGWLEVVSDEDDGRSQPFRLTERGRKTLEKAMPAWSRTQERVKDTLGPGLVDTLNQAIRRIGAASAKA